MIDEDVIIQVDGRRMYQCPICRTKHLTEEKHKEHVRGCFPGQNPPVDRYA